MSTVLSLICFVPSFQKMSQHFLLYGSLRPTNLEKNLKPWGYTVQFHKKDPFTDFQRIYKGFKRNKIVLCIVFLLLFDLIMSHPKSFSYKETGLPGLNQYKAGINRSCSRTQRSDAGEAQTRSPSVSSQGLYH